MAGGQTHVAFNRLPRRAASRGLWRHRWSNAPDDPSRSILHLTLEHCLMITQPVLTVL